MRRRKRATRRRGRGGLAHAPVGPRVPRLREIRMNEPWRRAEADRVSDDTLTVIADAQGRRPAEPMDPELQEPNWEDEKRVRTAFCGEDVASYKAAPAEMRREMQEYIQGGGR